MLNKPLIIGFKSHAYKGLERLTKGVWQGEATPPDAFC
jgi:hypothetical protein